MNARTRSRLVRAVIALVIGIAEPMIEVAWKCRAGFVTSESCVWGRSFLPLGRAVGLLLIAPVAYIVLTVVARLWRGRRSSGGHRIMRQTVRRATTVMSNPPDHAHPPIRESFLERHGTTLAVIGAAIIAAAFLAELVVQARHPGFNSAGAMECRASYRHARTATDTMMIDAKLPAMGNHRDPNMQSCGTLRRLGEL